MSAIPPWTGNGERHAWSLDVHKQPFAVAGKRRARPFTRAEISAVAVQVVQHKVVLRERAENPVWSEHLETLRDEVAILTQKNVAPAADAHVIRHVEHICARRLKYEAELFELRIVLPHLP